jgi:hypothetical protein
MSTLPNSFAAASAPACTDFQNWWLVPLGITAMRSFFVPSRLDESFLAVVQPANNRESERPIAANGKVDTKDTFLSMASARWEGNTERVMKNEASTSPLSLADKRPHVG